MTRHLAPGRSLERLRDVQVADVFKAGRLAARLERQGGLVTFRYAPGYDGPPVATTLPVAPEEVTTAGGAVPPFFAGLLPEGRRLSQLRKAVKTSADDELSLLLAVGGDTVGDVQVVPEGARPTELTPLVAVHRAWSQRTRRSVCGATRRGAAPVRATLFRVADRQRRRARQEPFDPQYGRHRRVDGVAGLRRADDAAVR